jgi:hypothetical protein
MAQAARSLPSAFIPENTENASEHARIPRYLIELPSGMFIADYVDDVLTETPRREEAKVFWSKRTAIANAEIFNGELLPAPQDRTPKAGEPAPGSDVDISALHALAIRIAEQAGCKFQGILRGHRRHKPLILFSAANVPKEMQTTMALTLFEFSVPNIRKHVQETMRRYGHAWNKARDAA